jgi:uncharacterized protein
MKMAVCVLFLTSLLSGFTPVWAESSVWEISKNGQRLFLGGTIHMLSDSDYPLPAAYDHAYQKSAVVVLETDAQAMQQPQFQQKMMAAMMYQDGRNLKQVLSEDTFKALSQHMTARGIPLDQMLLFKPGMISMTLSVVELQRLGQTAKGVDHFFGARAKQDGKSLGQLETIEQQITFLATMGKGREDDMIMYTLRDLADLPTILSEMKTAWRAGDMAALEKSSLEEMQEAFPEIYKTLLVDRNNDWMPQIEALLASEPVEFVLVGSLHLAGDDGVLQQLRSRGYQIKQM